MAEWYQLKTGGFRMCTIFSEYWTIIATALCFCLPPFVYYIVERRNKFNAPMPRSEEEMVLEIKKAAGRLSDLIVDANRRGFDVELKAEPPTTTELNCKLSVKIIKEIKC